MAILRDVDRTSGDATWNDSHERTPIRGPDADHSRRRRSHGLTAVHGVGNTDDQDAPPAAGVGIPIVDLERDHHVAAVVLDYAAGSGPDQNAGSVVEVAHGIDGRQRFDAQREAAETCLAEQSDALVISQ